MKVRKPKISEASWLEKLTDPGYPMGQTVAFPAQPHGPNGLKTAAIKLKEHIRRGARKQKIEIQCRILYFSDHKTYGTIRRT